MDLMEALAHLQNRLASLNMGKRLEWSLDDRSAVSLVCMNAAQQSVQADLPVRCAVCGGTEDNHHLAKHVFVNSAIR